MLVGPGGIFNLLHEFASNPILGIVLCLVVRINNLHWNFEAENIITILVFDFPLDNYFDLEINYNEIYCLSDLLVHIYHFFNCIIKVMLYNFCRLADDD